MTVLDVVREPNLVLHQVCDPVTQFDKDLERFVSDLFETMKANDGIGLAAPQVGVTKRIFVCQYKKERLVCINPKILRRSGSIVMEEGCLSLPDILAEVRRFEEVYIQAQDEFGNTYEKELDDMMAVIFQHENDHLDGILITSKGRVIDG